MHDDTADDLRGLLRKQEQVSLLSYKIRHSQQQDDAPLWDYSACENVIEYQQLPSPLEQIDLTLRWIGDSSKYAGDKIDYAADALMGFIGSMNEETVKFCLLSLHETQLIEKQASTINSLIKYRLTAEGWEDYNELVNQAEDSLIAFMAMKFGDGDLDTLVNEHLRPAVKQTGYTLSRVDDRPQAGLIDIKMRQDIKSCKFMIADLTHANPGAYWEAGFAEGVGKQVIYTCEESVFKETKTHFDVNHHLTIVWKKADMKSAAEQLKAAIRYTFPEAKQTD